MASYEDGYDPKYGYNRNAFAHNTPITAVLGVTVKLLASGVGLVSEAVHHRKDKKDAGSQGERKDSTSQQSDTEDPAIYVNVSPEQAEELLVNKQAVPADGQKATHELVPADVQDNKFDTDETDWALDDAATEAQGDAIEEDTPHDFKWRGGSVSNNKNGKSQRPSESLPFPIILPQRRPRTKTRGFVRAYAPILENSGIDQNMFMSFLQDLHKAAQASPIFGVVQIACNVASLYPDPLVGLGVQAVSIAAGIGQEIQERWQTNKYLDQANKELFEPRGLFALIVTYIPSNNKQTVVKFETVDIGAQAIARYNHPSEMQAAGGSEEEAKKPTIIEDLREMAKRLRLASGQTQGEAQMPAICAPLIFPTLDAVVDQLERDNRNNSERFANAMKSKTKNSSAFVADYFDRRAQAAYASANPNSTLANAMGDNAPRFTSRFADPNDATNTHLFTLLTGGRWKAEPLGARRRFERAQRKAEERRLKGLKEKRSKRMLQEGVIYLAIVNMPTQKELEQAKMQMAIEKAKKASGVKT